MQRGRLWRTGCVSLLVALGIAARGQCESLWEKRAPGREFLFQDLKARQVGDLLTLVISENTDVQNRENRGLSKDAANNGSLEVTSATTGKLGTSSADGKFELKNSSDRSFDGEATFSSAREFSDRVTVTVMDVLPNGNMVVTGKRRVIVAGDERTLVISGVIRQYDIGPDNSVQSRFVSALQMSYEGTGTEQRFTRQGWFGKSLGRIWPF